MTVDELAEHYHDVISGSNSIASTVRWAITGSVIDTLNKGNAYNFAGTQLAGGDTPHNNMQPYQAVYVFRRQE